VYGSFRHYADAVEAYDRAVALDPDNESLRKKRDAAKAKAEAEKLIKVGKQQMKDKQVRLAAPPPPSTELRINLGAPADGVVVGGCGTKLQRWPEARAQEQEAEKTVRRSPPHMAPVLAWPAD
jgi:hypothetical protein